MINIIIATIALAASTGIANAGCTFIKKGAPHLSLNPGQCATVASMDNTACD